MSSSLFAGHRFVFLTRAPTPNFKAVLTRYGGVFTVVLGATDHVVDEAALALADPALIKQVDSALLQSYAGRVVKPAFVTDSVRRGTIQPLERYLLVPASDAVPATDAAASSAATPVAATPARSDAVAPASSAASRPADSDDDVVELPAATAASSSAAVPNKSKAARPQATPSKRHAVDASVATQRPNVSVAVSPARSGRSDRPADFAVPALPAAQTATSKRKRSGGMTGPRLDPVQSPDEGDDGSVGSKRTRRSDGGDSLPPLERPTPPSPVTPVPTPARSPVSRAPVSASSKGSAPASASAGSRSRMSPSAALVSALVQEHRRRSLEKQITASTSTARSPAPAARPAVAPAPASQELDPDVRVAETPEEDAEDEPMHDDSAAAPPQPLPVAAPAEASQPANRASDIAAAVGFLESEGFSRPLIIHALLITSGSMKHARAYLHRTLAQEVHCWSAEEDHIIGGHDTQQTEQLVQQLGVDAVKRRTRFLCSEEV